MTGEMVFAVFFEPPLECLTRNVLHNQKVIAILNEAVIYLRQDRMAKA